ncbi:protein DOG1-like 4 [Momordica charantia]|uniref:Protein DOG1-like 4 n=1 Tax=Momordica charantia TaxID=3673 RepID=A0A6J1DRM2_MOMCH|nr:protein DOG1-like 4 [Momordica charantia]
MSTSSSSSLPRNGFLEHESFEEFFEIWLCEQNRYLKDLISVVENQMQQDVDTLIDDVVRHYENYYKVKSCWVEKDVLHMLRPSWRSSLEDAFLWLGGWRPSMAFHLLYSKSGMQLEAQLSEVLRGLPTNDLADISSDQLIQIDELKRHTIKEEKETTEKMAKHQETIADRSMVEMSHMATKSIMEGESRESPMEGRLKMELERKEDGLPEVLHMADELRLKTLKGILGILTKPQTVHFLMAAAELHLRIHDWGIQRDYLKH